jgi:uncharacterized phage protein (TIGR01671 family)
MDREILFRGKITKIPKYLEDNMKVGTWVYGSYVDYPGAQIVDLEDEYVVDPATVGQFTGLCDDKGQKVFEGDIIDVKARFKSEVRFIARNAGYLLKDNHGNWEWLFDVLASMPCEVIGNIHDKEEV